MRFDIITIFPGFFSGPLDYGVLKRACAAGLVEVRTHDLRGFTHDRHRTVDDRPFGGGEGMVLKPEPLAEALESLGIKPRSERASAGEVASNGHDFSRGATAEMESGASAPAGTRVILLSAQGRPFTQAGARELCRLDRI
ncbi:MAG TPA: hypothetical protein VFU66_01950, partial [Edaphobacter sp.]|nr:hypothetical protein [Edaphobacter sp.]